MRTADVEPALAGGDAIGQPPRATERPRLWRSVEAPGVMPLRFRSTTVRQAWRDAVGDTLTHWSKAWTLPTVEPSNVVVSALSEWSEARSMTFYPANTVTDAGLWCAWRRTSADAGPGGAVQGRSPHGLRPLDVLRRALFRSQASAGHARDPGAASLADEIAEAAWFDCCDRLARTSGTSPAAIARPGDARWAAGELPAGLWHPWSGALALELDCCGARLQIVASGESIDRWLRSGGVEPPAPTTPAASSPSTALPVALDTTPARLSVELEAFDIDLGSLGSLRIGDVLRTTHGLDRPLRVRLDGTASDAAEEPVCEAFLGKQGDVRVAELLSIAPLAS